MADVKQLRVIHGDGETIFRDNPQLDFQGDTLLIFEDRGRTQFLAGFAGAAWGMFFVEDQEAQDGG